MYGGISGGGSRGKGDCMCSSSFTGTGDFLFTDSTGEGDFRLGGFLLSCMAWAIPLVGGLRLPEGEGRILEMCTCAGDFFTEGNFSMSVAPGVTTMGDLTAGA